MEFDDDLEQRRQLADIQFDIEFAEAQTAPPKGRPGGDHWKDGGR